MRTSIATVCLAGTLDDKLAACAAAGFDGVEIFEPDLVVSAHTPEEIRARCADLGLTIDLYQPLRDIEGVPEERFVDNLRRARAKFDLMARLGADTLLVCSNVGTATIGDDHLMAAQLHRLADAAQPYGIRLAYEALAWGRHVDDYRHAADLVAAADHPLLGTCLDSFHILSRGDDPAGIEDLPAEKIFFVQLADAPALTMDVLSWSRHHRVFPGQGDWDLTTFTTHLMRAGYTGPLSLEIFNDTFRQSDPRRTAVDARRSLRWLEETTALRLADDSSPAPVPLATLPRVDDPTGFDFVEIRTLDPAPVDTLLRDLGFHDAGTHRTKNVRLWTLGEARICVNTAPTDVGRSTIAALGFVVDDPARAAARAVDLGSPTVARTSEADEEVLRAVRAPDGTEIFFCSSTNVWVREFGEPDPDSHHEHPGHVDTPHGPHHAALAPQTHTCAVDHVNLTQPWEHYDEGVLFLRSALSLDVQPSLDVASPVGLVRSQVMRTADGAVRLALNLAPPSAGNGQSTPRSPQHVAISCPDIVTFARQARDRGLPFLQIPDNYYDDLAARFALDEHTLATLRELDLLYDRDDNGEFWHFYTHTVGDVFLEVVERRGGYDGYGAPNAPVRLATQYVRRRRNT